jgi:hypothetical protein
LLDAALSLFRARTGLANAEYDGAPPDQLRLLRRQATAWHRYWHASLRATKAPLVFPQRCRQHRLNQTECEILAAMAIAELGLIEERITSCSTVLRSIMGR